MSSINPQEIDKFSAASSQWWNERGEFRVLHKLNPVRLQFIIDEVGIPFKQLSICDVGCGGGILSEPLARISAQVTAIDASEQAIQVAQAHAKSSQLNINYRCMSAEALVSEQKQFDVVTAMEIVEHVADLELFLSALAQLVKPGGSLFIATINRTVKSYLTTILAAEYLLRLVPTGTHHWEKFCKPSEIVSEIEKHSLHLKKIQGVAYNPLHERWSLSDDCEANYMLHFINPMM